jgi:hypothetical protein
MEFKSEHHPNVSSPILVTLLGIVIEVNFEQLVNAFDPILVKPSGRVTYLIYDL